jgi:hypothetical protein
MSWCVTWHQTFKTSSLYYLHVLGNRSTVGIVTRLQAGQLRKCSLIPCTGRWFVSPPKCPALLYDPAGILGHFPRGKVAKLWGWSLHLAIPLPPCAFMVCTGTTSPLQYSTSNLSLLFLGNSMTYVIIHVHVLHDYERQQQRLFIIH